MSQFCLPPTVKLSAEEIKALWKEIIDYNFEAIKDKYREDWEAHKPNIIQTAQTYSVKTDINKTIKRRKVLNTLTKSQGGK